ncbi:MAG: PIN domain-containing protein [Candidatus Bathyarchaeia archaeon]
MKLFIDSGPFIARHNRDDRYHKETLEIFNKIASWELPYTKLYCSDYIVDEAVTTCRMRTRSHKAAVELGEAILTSKSIVILKVDENTFTESWKLFKDFKELDLSLTDCTSIRLAQKQGIHEIFTFDKEFDVFGLHRIP